MGQTDRIRRRARTGSYVALAGVLGFTGCLLARFSAVLPRWDLLAMLTVVGAGVLLRALALRSLAARSTAPADQPRPDAPRTPPGFRAERRAWWPTHKSLASGVVFWLCAVPIALLAYSASNTTSVLDRVRDSDYTVAEVTVVSVKTKGHMAAGTQNHRTSVVTFEIEANTRPDLTGRPLEGTVRRDHGGQVIKGDQVWVMYDAGSASSKAVFATDRHKLDELAGGWTRDLGIWKVGLIPALICAVQWFRANHGVGDLPGQDLVAAAVHTGRARALRVRVFGVGAASVNKGRALKLTAADGDRDLLLGRWADLDHVANSLAGHSGWLYWARTVSDSPLPPRTRVGQLWNVLTLARLRANTGPRALDSAVLVLADGRYLRGRTPRVLDGPMAAGQPVSRRPPKSCPEARPVAPQVLRTPSVRPLALALGLPALITLLAMLTVPLGDLTSDGPTNAVLLTLTVLTSAYAAYRAATRPEYRL